MRITKWTLFWTQEWFYFRPGQAKNPEATYACVNYGEAVCPDEIKDQAICIDGDIGKILEELK
jgi:hypothetical protein